MLTIALAITVAVAIKVVGVLLIAAMLIIPAAAARPMSRTPEGMAIAAGLIGMLSAIIGLQRGLCTRYARGSIHRMRHGYYVYLYQLP